MVVSSQAVQQLQHLNKFGIDMAHTAYTPALDSENWDLSVGADGSLKMLKGSNATLQNVCNECRCFTDDLYFDRLRGIPWFSDQVGQRFNPSVVLSKLRLAAKNVDGIASVEDISLQSLDRKTRQLNVQIQVTTEDGVSGTITI